MQQGLRKENLRELEDFNKPLRPSISYGFLRVRCEMEGITSRRKKTVFCHWTLVNFITKREQYLLLNKFLWVLI